MTSKGLLIQLEADQGQDPQLERLLESLVAEVEAESDTAAWFAFRFGHGEYGIVTVFPDDAARRTHMNGAAFDRLVTEAEDLLVDEPSIQTIDVLADKLPAEMPATVAKGVLLTFEGNPDREEEVERFLRGARSMVAEEPHTVAWFALKMGRDQYGVFDVFEDNTGRFTHLAGRIPRELAKNALTLLGGMPDLAMVDVLEHRLRSPAPL